MRIRHVYADDMGSAETPPNPETPPQPHRTEPKGNGPTVASVPFMITHKMKAALRKRGLQRRRDQIDAAGKRLSENPHVAPACGGAA